MENLATPLIDKYVQNISKVEHTFFHQLYRSSRLIADHFSIINTAQQKKYNNVNISIDCTAMCHNFRKTNDTRNYLCTFLKQFAGKYLRIREE